MANTGLLLYSSIKSNSTLLAAGLDFGQTLKKTSTGNTEDTALSSKAGCDQTWGGGWEEAGAALQGATKSTPWVATSIKRKSMKQKYPATCMQ